MMKREGISTEQEPNEEARLAEELQQEIGDMAKTERKGLLSRISPKMKRRGALLGIALGALVAGTGMENPREAEAQDYIAQTIVSGGIGIVGQLVGAGTGLASQKESKDMSLEMQKEQLLAQREMQAQQKDIQDAQMAAEARREKLMARQQFCQTLQQKQSLSPAEQRAFDKCTNYYFGGGKEASR